MEHGEPYIYEDEMEPDSFLVDDDVYLEHVGVSKRDGAKVGSGRYPYGSGDHPYQRLAGLYGEYRKLKKQGLSDSEIGEQHGMSSGDLRARLAYYQAIKNSRMVSDAVDYLDKGYSNLEIAKKLGVSPTTVANYLKSASEVREAKIISTRNALKDKVDEVGWVEVGKGTENWMGVKRTMLDAACVTLYDEGYELYSDLRVMQGGSNNYSTMKVLARPGMTRGEVLADKGNPKATMADVISRDGGYTYDKKGPPVNISSDRIQIRYADDPISGKAMDGVIELRRGVPDLDLGKAHYAQVRIAVDDKYYAKGMAVYSDDLPDGVDIRVNSNKPRAKGIDGALKKQKHIHDDPNEPIDINNPFGTNTKEEPYLERASNFYIDPKDGKKKQSALNFVNEEGGWATWEKSLPSQFLGKQDPKLAKEQLNIDATGREREFEQIRSLTNPVLRSQLLYDFAGNCDSAAVHLKGAALPRQATATIIPAVTLKENEIYAPGLHDGEEVCLVRFPHQGIFEIPRLTVNNKNQEAKKRISARAKDAVCINPKVAEQLSGADFDGDTVLVLPTKKHDIKNRPYLEALKNVDIHEKYGMSDEEAKKRGIKIWKKGSPQEGTEMGKISNLITDMTFQDAPDEHLARAVTHAMVIIDVAKHNLDYKRSEQDNGIAELKRIYQPKYDEKTGKMRYGGAATLLSRSTKETKVYGVKSYMHINPETGENEHVPSSDMVPVRKQRGVDPVTGKKIYETVGWKPVERNSTMMMETKDAYKLTSGGSKDNPGTIIEDVYAEYANRMKALGNEARKAYLAAEHETPKKNPSAAKVYSAEVSSLMSKLNTAQKNAPLERRALALAQSTVELERQNAYGGMTKGEFSKRMDKEVKRAREILGAKRVPIDITDREWEAIQAGAVAKTNLKEIFKYTDSDRLRELALPKEQKGLSQTYINTAQGMLDRGYSLVEVADRFDVSVSTLSKYVD